MALKRKVISSDDSNKNNLIAYEADSFFDVTKITDYEQTFLDMKAHGTILSGEFAESRWAIKNKNFKAEIPFGLEIFKDIQIALKCYAIEQLENGKSPNSVQAKVRFIQESAIKTELFKQDTINRLTTYVSTLSKDDKNRLKIGLSEFLNFYRGEIFDNYTDYLEGLTIGKPSKRELHDYQSIFIFDICIKQSVLEKDEKLKLTYYPLFLWWRITGSIPMRPSEFLEIKYDCCYKDDDERYWLTVKRLKKEKDNYAQENIVEETLEVPFEVYYFIEDYKSLLREEWKSPFLINYRAYNATALTPQRKNSALGQKANPDYIEIHSLRYLFIDYYNKVVNPKYPNATRLKPGDTRHLAFCNILFQGKNPLTAAEMGGHLDLDSQFGYYSHLKPFSQSYVKFMVDNNALSEQFANLSGGSVSSPERRSQLLGTYSNEQLKKMTYIDGGYCRKSEKGNKVDYAKCPTSNCSPDCEHHIPDVTRNPCYLQQLQEQKNNLHSIWEEQIELLESTYKELIQGTSIYVERDFKSAAAQIRATMERQIKNDLKIIDFLGLDSTSPEEEDNE